MSFGQPDLGEQMLSKAAEVGMKSQLDEAESLDVDIRTDAGKLMQGELESVDVEGKGLVMEKSLRAETLKMKTDNIAIDPLKAAFGDIQLTRPTHAKTHVVLTEQDIERAFNSDYICAKLQNLQVRVDDQPLTVNTRAVKFRLPGNQKVELEAEIEVQDTQETKQVAFSAVPAIAAGGNQVELKDVQYQDGKEVSPELTAALLDSAGELLDLRNFELEGMAFRLSQLDVSQGKITLQAEATIDKFPGNS